MDDEINSGHISAAKILIKERVGLKEEKSDASIQKSFSSAIKQGSVELVEALIDAYSPDPGSLIQEALLKGHYHIVKILLDRYPFLANQKTSGLTPLIIASLIGDVKYAQLLLKAGAKLEDTSGGLAAIHYASRNEHQEIVKILVAHDPNIINLKADNGITPLMFAVTFGKDDLAAFCLDQGADHKMRADNGWSAYDYAIHDFLKLRTPHPDFINRLGGEGVKEKSLELFPLNF